MISKSKKTISIRVLIWFSIIVVLTLSVFAIFLATFDINLYRKDIEKSASQFLNRQVELRGDISMGISLIPTVVVRDMSIGNPEWAESDSLAVINKLELKIEILSLLLHQQLRVNDIGLTGVRVNLEKDPLGNNNWTFEKGYKTTQSTNPYGIKEVYLQDIKISYRIPDKQLVDLVIKNAKIGIKEDEILALKIDGQFQGDEYLVDIIQWDATQGADISPSREYKVKAIYKEITLSSRMNLDVGDGFEIGLNNFKLMVGYPKSGGFSLHNGKLQWGSGTDLQIDIDGNRSDIPFNLSAKAGSIGAMLDGGRWPVQADVVLSQNKLNITGTVSDLFSKPAVNVQAELQGNAMSQLSGLTDFPLPTVDQYHIKASVTGADQKYLVQIPKANLSGNELSGELNMNWQQTPRLIAGNIRAGKLSINELRPSQGDQSQQRDQPGEISTFAPENMNIDLKINIKALDGLPVRASNLVGKVNIRNKRIAIRDLRFSVPSGHIQGALKLRPDVSGIDYSLELYSKQQDIHQLLLGHKVSGKTLTGNLNNVSLSMKGTGGEFDKLLQQSKIDLKMGKSSITLSEEDGEKSNEEQVDLEQVHLTSEPGKSVQLYMEGRLRDAPASLKLETVLYPELAESSMPHPLKLTASYADHVLHANGTVDDMQIGKGMRLALALSGKQLATMGPLFDVDLLTMGPYSLKGQLKGKSGRYIVQGIEGNINQTDVSGHLEVTTDESRPAIVASLTASRLYYQDIFSRAERGQGKKLIPEYEIPDEFLRAFDATVDVRSKQLFIGEVEYTNFIMHADLKDGVLKVDPLDAQLRGSNIHSSLEVAVVTETPTVQWKLNTTNSDYGRMLESLDLTDKVEGLADVEISLLGHGATLRDVLANADGRVQIIAGQGKIKEPGFDLWAAGLVTSMLSSTWEMKEEASVQCIVARFDIKDGQAVSDTLMLDTTEITVAGTAHLDLKSEKIDAVIQPAPKNPSLVSLANPVKLSGNLRSPKVTVEKSLGREWSLGGVLLGLANPGTLLLMYSDLGSGVENPCYVAALNREAKEAEAEEAGLLKALKLPRKLLEKLF